MMCPCSFDWKLFVDFLKTILSFPVVTLVLGLIILNRYRAEIRKKIAGMTKASAAGAELLFSPEEVIAIAESVANDPDNASSTPEESMRNLLSLLGYINDTFKMVFQQTQAQLSKEGKNINDPVELLMHKQEWVDKIFQMHPDLVSHYGKDAMYRAIDNRVGAYLNFARAVGYKNPTT